MDQPHADLPATVKERLLQLAHNLPESSQGSFLAGAADRLTKVTLDHPNTLVFAAIGWLLGEIVDNLLTVHVPFADLALCLTGGRFSALGMAGGALFGLHRDVQKNALRVQVAQIIGEELQRALPLRGTTRAY